MLAADVHCMIAFGKVSFVPWRHLDIQCDLSRGPYLDPTRLYDMHFDDGKKLSSSVLYRQLPETNQASRQCDIDELTQSAVVPHNALLIAHCSRR